MYRVVYLFWQRFHLLVASCCAMDGSASNFNLVVFGSASSLLFLLGMHAF